MSDPQPEYLTIKQVCERMNVSRRTVYNWIERGLKARKIGRLRRIKVADLEQFIEEEDRRQRGQQD